MEMAGPLVHHKVGWKHFKCRCTWDGQTHTDFASATHTLTHTHTNGATTTTLVLNNEEQVVVFSLSL